MHLVVSEDQWPEAWNRYQRSGPHLKSICYELCSKPSIDRLTVASSHHLYALLFVRHSLPRYHYNNTP